MPKYSNFFLINPKPAREDKLIKRTETAQGFMLSIKPEMVTIKKNTDLFSESIAGRLK